MVLAASSAAPSPAVSSTTSSAPAASNGASTTGGEAAFDPAEFMDRHANDIETLRQEQRALAQRTAKAEAHSERIRRAASGEGEPRPVEVDPYERLVDKYLDAALKNKEQGGQGMPLTTELAIELSKLGKQSTAQNKLIMELKAQLEQQQNPVYQGDRAAYNALDHHLQTAVEGVFGSADPEMFQAAAAKTVEFVKKLQAEKPAEWDKIRRNPDYLKRIAEYHVELTIPPKVRERMNQERVQNTPLSVDDLKQAMREADVEYANNPTQRAAVKQAIRIKLLEKLANHGR